MRSVREIVEREEKTGERHYGQPSLQWHHFIEAKVFNFPLAYSGTETYPKFIGE
jgi:hypothetical protein